MIEKRDVEKQRQYRSNFIPLFRGLKDHVIDGRMSSDEFSLFVWILLNANPYNGLYYANANIIAAHMRKKEHSVRRALKSLTMPRRSVPDGYIYYDGTRGLGGGAYPILVLKYPIPDGGKTTIKDYPERDEKLSTEP